MRFLFYALFITNLAIIPFCFADDFDGADIFRPERIYGSAELSFNIKDKALKEFQFKHRLDLQHEFEQWRNNYLLDIYAKTSQVIDPTTKAKRYKTSGQKWSASAQSKYVLSNITRRYAFGYGSYTDNRFSKKFDFQSVMALGYGKRWIELDDGFFDAEIGLGLSLNKAKEHGTRNRSMVRIASTFEKQLLNDMQFKQVLGIDLATQSDRNTKITQMASLTTKLMKSLALKFNFILDHNTIAEEDNVNTNTETSLILVYNF